MAQKLYIRKMCVIVGMSLSEQHSAGSILSCHKSCMYILNLSNLNYRFMVHEQLNLLHCMEYKKCFTAAFVLSCTTSPPALLYICILGRMMVGYCRASLSEQHTAGFIVSCHSTWAMHVALATELSSRAATHKRHSNAEYLCHS